MKLKITHAMALCALTLLTSQQAWADNPQATLHAIGTITAGSCELQLSKDTYDFGSIAKEILNDTDTGTKLLEPPPIKLTIDCGTIATQVGIAITDSKDKSRIDGLTIANSDGSAAYASSEHSFGFGWVNNVEEDDKRIGAYRFDLKQGTVDGNSATFALVKRTAPVVGTPTDHLFVSALDSKNGSVGAWAKKDKKELAPGKLFTAELHAQGAIGKKTKLDLSSDITLSGQATLTVYYL